MLTYVIPLQSTANKLMVEDIEVCVFSVHLAPSDVNMMSQDTTFVATSPVPYYYPM